MHLLPGLKKIIGENAPKWLVLPLRRLSHRLDRTGFLMALLSAQIRDGLHFFRWSHSGKADDTRLKQENAIIKAYHGFEKGLALSAPRPGFGQDKARSLMAKITSHESAFGASNMIYAARAALRDYLRFNQQHSIAMPWLESWLAEVSEPAEGGTMELTRAAILDSTRSVKPAFFLSRHSIRDFAPGEVPLTDIEDAVRLAQKAPSACNRQGPRVHCFARAEEALQWQPGNRGFGHLASRGLVITADLQAFCSMGERSQAFIDGGIFAMALVYALHAKGYGTCMLAWNKSPREETAARQALGIPDSEVIIMMIAVGLLPETLSVAVSQRRSLSEVLRIWT